MLLTWRFATFCHMVRLNASEAILGLVRRTGSVTNRDVVNRLGVTRQVAHYHLSQLVERGQIELVGAGRGAFYRFPIPEEEFSPVMVNYLDLSTAEIGSPSKNVSVSAQLWPATARVSRST